MQPVIEFKQEMAKKLLAAASTLESEEKLQICVDLKISTKTFERYCSGNPTEVRRIEFAEDLLKKLDAVISVK